MRAGTPVPVTLAVEFQLWQRGRAREQPGRCWVVSPFPSPPPQQVPLSPRAGGERGWAKQRCWTSSGRGSKERLPPAFL